MLILTKKKIITALLTALLLASLIPVQAESLFRAGVAQNVSPVTPRSWYAGLRATNIGDIVTIVVQETNTVTSTIELSSNKNTTTTDNWSSILDRILPGKGVVPNVDGWGGSSKVSNNATLERENSLSNSIAAQVVQVLPNGNLVVQARKSVINSGDRQDFVLSGIINPRYIDGTGSIRSMYVANMQLAIVGKGTVSRVQSDGVMNKLLRVFF